MLRRTHAPIALAGRALGAGTAARQAGRSTAVAQKAAGASGGCRIAGAAAVTGGRRQHVAGATRRATRIAGGIGTSPGRHVATGGIARGVWRTHALRCAAIAAAEDAAKAGGARLIVGAHAGGLLGDAASGRSVARKSLCAVAGGAARGVAARGVLAREVAWTGSRGSRACAGARAIACAGCECRAEARATRAARILPGIYAGAGIVAAVGTACRISSGTRSHATVAAPADSADLRLTLGV